jgi:hypothetical protein
MLLCHRSRWGHLAQRTVVQCVKCRKSWGVRGRGWVQNIKVGIRNYLGLRSRRSLQILEGGRPIPLLEEGKVAVVEWISSHYHSSCFALQASLRPATCVGGGLAFSSTTAARFEQEC